ncbi:GntR family transcriptional regulator [Cytobacillus eiseniae]|uniref:GntR family transcriptional regulator n=1 Tax=Cytobacillus eiseniae TaxID=762947 RepID=A0ABS4RII3_9BACI|nr:GntR family transcriptional regulator [Cytobacillus eiseniae]MBP2242676.1 GntR family transcriptional regulator [Cytobacillus eiseniae]
MIILIEAESEIPIYSQLTNQVIEGIARGDLCPGDSLPSVRAFAADIGVNMHTVNKSYHELEKRGIIKIIPKSGAVISTHTEIPESTSQRLSNELKPLIAESLVIGMTEEKIHELVTSILKEFKQN